MPRTMEILHKNNPLKINGSDFNIMCKNNPQNAQSDAKEKTVLHFLKPIQAMKISTNPMRSLKISI